MGLSASKVCKQVPREDLQEGSIPSTPILAPKTIKQEELDPRSPSAHISRTPLELLSAAALKLKEEVAAYETPAKSNTILLGIDPRSPTVEFKRTPIIINVPQTNTSEKIRNKALDKVRKSVITTPKTTQKYISKSVPSGSIVPPKLLESSPVGIKLDTHKRKSFVGLLETNIDFTETDLDEVIRRKSKIRESLPAVTNTVVTLHRKQFDNLVQTENIDPRSPTNDFIRTPLHITKNITDLNINDEADYESESKCIIKETKHTTITTELFDQKIVEQCVQEICDIVCLGIEPKINENELVLQDTEHRNSLLLEEISANENTELDGESEESQDEEVTSEVPVAVKSAPITPPMLDGNVKFVIPAVAKQTQSAPITPPVVSFTSGVQELDKKLTNLIYQDEDIIICPRKVKLKDYDSRSPLRSLNSNEPEKKKSQKLKVNEMKKSEYTVSKIPVFKEKCKKTEVQCENTPPRNLEKRKIKIVAKFPKNEPIISYATNK